MWAAAAATLLAGCGSGMTKDQEQHACISMQTGGWSYAVNQMDEIAGKSKDQAADALVSAIRNSCPGELESVPAAALH